MSLHEEMIAMGDRAVVASRALAQLSARRKNAILEAMATELETRRTALKEANALDMEAGRAAGPVQRPARSPAAQRRPHRQHDQGHSGRGRPQGSRRPKDQQVGPSQRARDHQGPRAHRRHRHHLRGPPQRHRGRGRAVHQNLQRGHPARRQGSAPLQPGRGRCPAGGRREEGPARRTPCNWSARPTATPSANWCRWRAAWTWPSPAAAKA
jgi:hypothetical protein